MGFNFDDYYNDYSNSSYGSLISSSNNYQSDSVSWSTVSLILALLIAVIGYIAFVKNSKEYTNKFVNYLKNFLDFKKMFIEDVVKIGYIFLTTFIILYSFSLIKYSFWLFLLTLVFGIIIIRLIFEFSSVLLMIWKNTSEINKKTKDNEKK